jgi:hypothetical protein
VDTNVSEEHAASIFKNVHRRDNLKSYIKHDFTYNVTHKTGQRSGQKSPVSFVARKVLPCRHMEINGQYHDMIGRKNSWVGG